MTEWSSRQALDPLVTLSTLSVLSAGGVYLATGVGVATWPTANKAVFVPLRLPCPFLLTNFFWQNGTTVSGNVDCGLYTGDLTTPVRLARTATTAQAGTSAIQVKAATLDTGFNGWLQPGLYYLALVLSSIVGTIESNGSLTAAGLQALGCFEQTLGSASLPTTATPASTSVSALFIFGLTSKSAFP